MLYVKEAPNVCYNYKITYLSLILKRCEFNVKYGKAS